MIAGVAASEANRSSVLIAGVAALLAGAMSMAAGECVSVSSQADTERVDLAREAEELHRQPELELEELTRIYQSRGIDRETAVAAATQMMAKDALPRTRATSSGFRKSTRLGRCRRRSHRR